MSTSLDLTTWSAEPLRRHFRDSEFTQEKMEALGLHGLAYQGKDRVKFRSALPAGTAVEALARCFILGETLTPQEASLAFGSLLDELLGLGIVISAKEGYRADWQIMPLGSAWIACDFLIKHRDSPEDYVMGSSPVTQFLSSLLPPLKQPKALDLGCGMGVVGLYMREHFGATVTGIDINQRGMRMALFNQKIAATDRVEWKTGSWFEPVAGEKFDLIACNPPFVQSPGGDLVYRETPQGQPNPCQLVIQGSIDHLAEGGFAVIILNWSHRTADDWEELPLSWADQPGVRRFLFQGQCHTPAEYAWRWIKNDPKFPTPEAAEAEVARWVRHHEQLGTGAISSGFIILQKCAEGQEWVRTDSRFVDEINNRTGAEIARLFANESWLAEDRDEATILDTVYTVPEGIKTEIVSTLTPGKGWSSQTIRLTSPGLLAYDGQIDETLMRLLELSALGQPPRTLLNELAKKLAQNAQLPSQIAQLTQAVISYGLITPKA